MEDWATGGTRQLMKRRVEGRDGWRWMEVSGREMRMKWNRKEASGNNARIKHSAR